MREQLEYLLGYHRRNSSLEVYKRTRSQFVEADQFLVSCKSSLHPGDEGNRRCRR